MLNWLKGTLLYIHKFSVALILVFGFTLNVNCQSFLNEKFNSQQMPPNGWSLEVASEQWSISETNIANGTIPEAMFTWLQLIDTSRLITPEINLTGYQEVSLQFKHMYDYYEGEGPAVGVATRSDGSDWNSAWEIQPVANVGPEHVNLSISNEDVGQPDFQLCFYVKGNFWNLNYWYLDDILLFVPIKLKLTMFLEGPFEENEMKNDLNLNGLLPFNQPYSTYPWEYYGNETVTSIPDINIIDWVLVELVEINDEDSPAFTSYGRQAAFLFNDGSIKTVSGINTLLFHPPTEDSLHIMIHHRNHLAAISNNFIQLVNGVCIYDFTHESEQTYMGQYTTKEITESTWGTLMGDGNRDGQIDNRDKNEFWHTQSGSNGYYYADYNMDGLVDTIDMASKLKENLGKGNRKTDSVATPFACGSQFIDSRNGVIYETVQIGSQCWMANNLNYATTNSWCYYNNLANCDTLGRLYNWTSIMNGEPSSNAIPSGVQGICPAGWHLPSDAEWCILTNYVDPTTDCQVTGYNGTDAGTKMKSISGWSSGGNGTNESGFNVPAAGSMGIYHFDDLHLYAYTWSCTEDYPGYAWYRKLSYGLPSVGRFFIAKSRGCSVRCLKD